VGHHKQSNRHQKNCTEQDKEEKKGHIQEAMDKWEMLLNINGWHNFLHLEKSQK
jgi:hypothetical protein